MWVQIIFLTKNCQYFSYLHSVTQTLTGFSRPLSTTCVYSGLLYSVYSEYTQYVSEITWRCEVV